MKPIEDENSPCFGCTAMMCGDACRGEQYYWEIQKQEKHEKHEDMQAPKEFNVFEILVCGNCGFSHDNPIDFRHYGTTSKCPKCNNNSLRKELVKP